MSQKSNATRVVKVFLSYAHQDEEFKDKLLSHLSPLRRQGLIESWDDRKIRAGGIWDEEILKHFNEADVILCLISADFINSEYCHEVEMKRAWERRELEKVKIIPILLRHVDWLKTPFRRLQAIPRDNKPVTGYGNRDKAFMEIAQEIGIIIDNLGMENP